MSATTPLDPGRYETRGFTDLEIRKDAPDGRTIVGIAVPYEQVADVGSYRESFAFGAFRAQIQETGVRGVRLKYGHRRDLMPLGAATELREEASGLHAEFRVSRTERGDEVLELVRDGVLDSLSVGFQAIRSKTRSDGVVMRTVARLMEVSVVDQPAYAGAAITATRDQAMRADDLRSYLDSLRG